MDSKTVYLNLLKRLAAVTESPSFEALELIRHFCGVKKEQVFLGEGEIPEEALRRLEAAVSKRVSGYPLQYLLGEWDFYGRTYHVGEGVLIPRADTETLVEAVLEWCRDRQGLTIADLCSGSGCIAVTLERELSPKKVYAVENSPAALSYLRENVEGLGAKVDVVADDVLSPKADLGTVDLIVSNPPYVAKSGLASLQKEVAAEPESALYGGEDGLDFYRGITRVWKSRLKRGGAIFYEIGMGQEADVEQILRENGFSQICTYRDICGIIRVIKATKAQESEYIGTETDYGYENESETAGGTDRFHCRQEKSSGYSHQPD